MKNNQIGSGWYEDNIDTESFAIREQRTEEEEKVIELLRKKLSEVNWSNKTGVSSRLS